jgi:DNA-binding Lrp family transcriptional regulator
MGPSLLANESSGSYNAMQVLLMPKAFIMIDVEPGTESSVENAVRKIAGVNMVYQVTGEHDLIAFIDAEPYEEFANILSSIRHLSGVRDTDSNLVL